MSNSIVDLFKAETEIEIKAGELFGIMREAVKAEFLMNAANCEVPYSYAREMATGQKEQAAGEDDPTVMSAAIEIHASEVAEAVKRTVLQNAVGQQDANAPTKIYQMKKAAGAAGEGSGSVGIIRKNEQRVEWIDIQDIIRKGRAGVSLPVGTEINFELKNGDQATAVIVAQDHYDQGDVVFWLRKIVGRGSMNDDDANEGGFAASKMRGYLEKEIFNLLPDALQDAIAVHTVIQIIDDNPVDCDCHLFLPSEYELQGRTDWSEYNGQDKQFEFTKERRNRVAYDDDGDPCWYWTAGPSAANTTAFCLFDSTGDSTDLGASLDGGTAPLFVIK